MYFLLLCQAALKTNIEWQKCPELLRVMGSKTQSKNQFIKMALTSRVFPFAFYSSAMLMRCNNLLKENLLT
jgi:hypothetical protein